MDGIELAGLYAVAESHAAVLTVFRAAAWYEGHGLAALYTAVVVLRRSLITVSDTSDMSYHTDLLSCIYAHDGTDFCGYRSSSDRALVYRSFSCNDGMSASRASGITAATAVISRKYSKHFLFSGIHFYFELLRSQTEKESDQTAGRTDYHCCDNYST